MASKVILVSNLSPAPVVALSGAIRDIAKSYPGRFTFSFEGPNGQLLQCNPNVDRTGQPKEGDTNGQRIELADVSSPGHVSRPLCLVSTWLAFLNDRLGVSAPLTVERGDVHVCADDRIAWTRVFADLGRTQRYAVIAAYPSWGHDNWQKVVSGVCTCTYMVQVGSWLDGMLPLNDAKNVLMLVGRTDNHRELIRTIWFADMVVTTPGFIADLAAALPARTPYGRPIVLVTPDMTPDDVVARIEVNQKAFDILPFDEVPTMPRIAPVPDMVNARKVPCKTCPGAERGIMPPRPDVRIVRRKAVHASLEQIKILGRA